MRLGLKPWTADNFDVSLEYYTRQGGVFTAGVFLKEIDDFFANDVRRITAAEAEESGLDPRFAGFEVTTKINAGAEMNLRRSLAPLGGWGQHFSGVLQRDQAEARRQPAGGFQRLHRRQPELGRHVHAQGPHRDG